MVGYSYIRSGRLHKHSYPKERLLKASMRPAWIPSASERICCSPRKFLSSEKTRSHEAELGVKVKMIPVTPDSSRVVTAVLEVKGPDSFW